MSPNNSSSGRFEIASVPRIRGIALDMDGLMFDTEPLYHRAADTYLARWGHRYEDSIRRQMMGQPGPKAVQILIEYYEIADHWETVLKDIETIFASYLDDSLRALPGLSNLLALFDMRDLPYGVATSSRRLFAEDILRRGGIVDRLRFLWTGDDVMHGKPDPEIYLKSADSLGISPCEMLVLEDSGNGCKAAIRAGAITVAVPGPHSAEHDFSGALLVANSLQDQRLIDLVQQHSVGRSP